MIQKIIDLIDSQELQSVSGMDATFLYGETANSPMHIGGLAVIEGSLDFNLLKETIASRIHMIPKLRKRLVNIPFSMDYPCWVDDPDFNLDMHLHHVALPKPGDWSTLRKMTSKIFSQSLDRNRPLWSFTFVEGLDALSQVKPGSVAIISKIHHVAIDGVAGAGILGMLFDFTPDAKPPAPAKEYKPKPIPNEIALMLKSGIGFTKKPLKFPGLIKETFSATVKAGFLTRAQHLDLPTAPFTAPSTPFNKIIAAERKWNTSILSLDRIKELKKIMGTTVNDIMLAICSGALRRYLLEKDKLPKKPLVAMVPISTRSDSDGSEGNQLSSMLVQLATDIEDPIERLEAIYENTIKGKTYQGAIGAKSLSNIAEAVPFGIANQAARLYSRYNLSKLHKPVFNLVITNVPGPQMPLYIGGKKLHSICGMAPIIDGMGLIITILSYNGNVTISPTSDANSMPDLNLFSNYILESANELETMILNYDKNKPVKKKSKQTTKTDKPTKSKKIALASDAYFDALKKFIKANPSFIRPDSGIYQFFIKGPDEAEWQLNLNKSPASIRRGKLTNFDVSMTIEDKHLVKIANGDLAFATALVQGRLAISGDFVKAKKLGTILSKIQAEINK